MIEVHAASLDAGSFSDYERLVRHVPYGVNLHPLWLKTYLEAFGHKEVMLEARERDTDELVALLPLVRDDVHQTRYYTLRRLTSAGYGPADFFDLPCMPGREAEAADAFADWFEAHSDDWDLLLFENVPDASTSFDAFAEALRDRGHGVDPSTDASYLTIDATGSYDEYVDRWGSKNESEIDYYRRRSAREGEVSFEADSGRGEEAFDEFMDVYNARRSSKDQSDPFVRMPALEDFMRRLISAYGSSGWMPLAELRIDGTPASYTYYLRFDGVMYYYMPTFREEYNACAPGKVALATLIRLAFEDPEIREFNFMRGAYSYKLWYAPEQQDYRRLLVRNARSRRLKLRPVVDALSGARKKLTELARS